MKILVVQESDWIKRNPHQQHHLMERLSMRGHEIRIIDHPINWKEDNNYYTKRDVVEGYYKIHPEANLQVIRPSILKLPYLNYVHLLLAHRNEIKYQIKEFKPDVVIGFGIMNTYIASAIAQKEKIPFIYYWIDVLHKLIPEKMFHSLGKYMEIATIKKSAKVITINHKLKEYVTNLGAQNTEVIGAGIDFQKFDHNLNSIEIRQKLGVLNEDILLFFMGYLYHFAGLKEVAMELNNSKYENVKLLIVGEGDAYSDLTDIIKEYNLENKVFLVGHKKYEEIPNYVAASNICILPAYPDEIIMQDIVPIKIYEYMAMGKPVISTILPGIMKEFGNENGILYVNEPSIVPQKALNIDVKLEGNKAINFAKNCDWNEITNNFEECLYEITN